jgi:hypothetical protein
MTHPVLRAVVLLSAFGAFPLALRAETPRVAIRIYDVAPAGPEMRTAAMHTASAIVRQAGVTVEWMDCSAGGAHHPCRTVPDVRELVVRIMPVPENGTDRSRDALSIRRMAGIGDQQLGFAAVGDASRSGILATVYLGNVQIVARNSGVSSGELLGRAIAHEVGHLLLPGGGHSPSGLMRAPWVYEELTENRREDWLFSPQDEHQLRAALAR